jgi:phage terminase small subunit
MAELTVLQSKFITQYLLHGVGSKAVTEAGGSPNGASVTANRFLKNPKIAAEIARRREVSQKKSELTTQKLMDALNDLVDFDPAKMYDADGKLLRIVDMDPATRKAIAGIEEDLIKGTKLRLSSRLQSIELAAKILGMLKSEPQQNQGVTIILAPPPEIPPAPAAPLLPNWGD